jgi:excinuclease ABC subunit B
MFRVKGDTVDIFLAYADYALRVVFFGNEIESIKMLDPVLGRTSTSFDQTTVFPANLFVTSKETLHDAIWQIQQEMVVQTANFNKEGKSLEAKRLEERVNYDIEMMKELGYCSGIENYSRYFDRRQAGERPFCLLDYFPNDFLMVIDESHVSVPQVGAMFGGDRSRKVNLIEHGFRLISAMDNRPLTFDEFESIQNQVIFVSATPADFELRKTEGVVIEQVVRPTGLLDPPIEVRPSLNQVDDLMNEIQKTIEAGERVLVTTLTKRMAEELHKYLDRMNVKCRYIHSEVDTLERINILGQLREGEIDVLIGVNLLREGLDLPEVSLVAILDADKEGFLRNRRSLTQTAGRAARNVHGRVIFYADKITGSMAQTIDETERRRQKQMEFNTLNGIEPTQIFKHKTSILRQASDIMEMKPRMYSEGDFSRPSIAADPVMSNWGEKEIQKAVVAAKRKMEKAAENLEFMEAAQFRDEMKALEERLVELNNLPL